MPFETFIAARKDRTSVGNVNPRIGIQLNGHTFDDFVGQRVEVLYDKERNVIGLRPATDKSGNRYKVSSAQTNWGSYSRVTCVKALEHFQIPASRITSIEVVDGIYELHLQPKETPNAETNTASDH